MHMELAVFQDRAEAGRVLADRLTKYAGSPEVVVLALPRGGVPVGFRVARSLGAPLDVLSVRKLGVPGREELAMGAIASDGTRSSTRRWCANSASPRTSSKRWPQPNTKSWNAASAPTGASGHGPSSPARW